MRARWFVESYFEFTRPRSTSKRNTGITRKKKTILVFYEAILIQWPLLFFIVYFKSSGFKSGLMMKDLILVKYNALVFKCVCQWWIWWKPIYIYQKGLLKNIFGLYWLCQTSFSVPHNFHKQQGCTKRQKIGRNQWLCCSTIFPLCCCVLRCWMWPSSVWTESEIPAAGYTALHLLTSYKTKAFATLLGFLWVAEEKACGDSCSAAAEPEEQRRLLTQPCEWKSTAQHWPQLCCFPSFTRHTSTLSPVLIQKHSW